MIVPKCVPHRSIIIQPEWGTQIIRLVIFMHTTIAIIPLDCMRFKRSKASKNVTFWIREHFHSATKHCLQHCVWLCRQCCDRRVKQMTTNIQFNILWWISIDYCFVITRHCTRFRFRTARFSITLNTLKMPVPQLCSVCCPITNNFDDVFVTIQKKKLTRTSTKITTNATGIC